MTNRCKGKSGTAGNGFKKSLTVAFAAALVCVALLAGCTDNPFADNGQIKARNRVSGQLVLPPGAQPVRAFVWLDTLKIGAFAGENGRFTLTLPRPALQPDNGYSGSLKLYVYIGNYKLESRLMLMRDGEFLYGQADVDNNGNLKEPLQMQRLLEISTGIIPAIISPDFDETLQIDMTLRAVAGPQQVLLSRVNNELLAGFVAWRTDTSAWMAVDISRPAAVPATLLLDNLPYTISTVFAVPEGLLPEGEYSALPYLWVEQPGLPEGLLQALAAPFGSFSTDYARVPFERTGGAFTVSLSKDSLRAK